MKFTLSWLHAHLDSTASLAEIVDKLTLIGLEVEALSDPSETFANFEVAEILATEPHPEADRLQICTVKSGAGEQKLVCGAPNARAGLIGILAQEGAVIPANGMVLGKAKIRGVESRGMMCSGAELGLSDDHDGIIELADAPKIGTPAAEALGLNDPMIEIGITPNRPDCLGVRGIARDLAAAAAKSRAMPRTPKQSGRLGVMPISIIGSFNPNASAAGVPIFGASASSIMPSWSSDRPSSAPEHIMPRLSTPRIFALPSTMPLAGITAPSCAKMPIRPARALGAPHTSFCSPAPLFTVQICKRSASGCGSVARISATSKLAKVSDGSLSASTSSPIRVNLSTISASEAVLSRWACSQERVNFICRSYLSALRAARDLSDRPAARPGTSIGTKP